MSEIRLQLRDIEPDDVSRLAADLNVELPEGAALFIDPVTATVVGGLVFAGARLIIRLRNEWQGGVVIDRTKEPIEIRRERNLPYGFFVVIGTDGSVRIEAKDEPKDVLERMSEALLTLATPTTDAMTAAVQQQLGGAAKVQVLAA
jgi:hypothetical protein